MTSGTNNHSQEQFHDTHKCFECLCSPSIDQPHIVQALRTNPEAAQKVLTQINTVQQSYPGGIEAYLRRARALLQDSKAGVNQFEGYTPKQPQCFISDPEQDLDGFVAYEKAGLDELPYCAFVLVAGGLGERLGFPDIKINLPTESCTGITYVEYYFQTILSLQNHARLISGRQDLLLPVAIMTSGDTHQKTLDLLEKQHFFGLTKGQVTLLQQEKVPALQNCEGKIAIKANGELEMKPHGHGDVHVLLHRSNLVHQWEKEGFKHVFFFQDTNALAFRALPFMLGTSAERKWCMNSLTVERTPGEAVGAICRLVPPSGKDLTINIEYNQLDSLLKANGMKGDVADERTGKSVFPGNCNVLLFNLKRYALALIETGGTIPEFINPKYSDPALKSEFKSPARLECMMQEFARVFDKDADEVGCVMLPRWMCFSTVKNNDKDAATKVKTGGVGESWLTAECDLYECNLRCLKLAAKLREGASVVCDVPSTPIVANDVQALLGPMVVLHPSVGGCCITLMSNLFEKDSSLVMTQGGNNNQDKPALIMSGPVRLGGVVKIMGGTAHFGGEGDSDKNVLTIRNLTVQQGATELVPIPESDLSKFNFAFQIRGFASTFHPVRRHKSNATQVLLN